MIPLAERTRRIDSSGIRKVFNLAAQMSDPVNLSIGQPDFDVPEPVKEAAIQAIRDGHNRYTLTAGIPPLKEKLLRRYRDERGIPAEDIIITSGVSGGILLAFMVLLNEGDEVIVPDPYFVMYKHLANFIGAKPVYVSTYPDFRLKRQALEAAITSRTRLILVNSPANPSGAVATAEDLAMVAEVAKRHGLAVVSDEIYEPFVYEGEYVSMGSFLPDAIILSGLSKAAAMTGWRLGWALGPREVIAAMSNVQMYSFVCAPSFAQVAALPALDLDFTRYREQYRRRRDLLLEGLSDLYEIVAPGGSFYMFPAAPGGDGDAFVKRAIDSSLLVVPGSVFSERKTHFRISFAASDETCRRGIEILRRLAQEG